MLSRTHFPSFELIETQTFRVKSVKKEPASVEHNRIRLSYDRVGQNVARLGRTQSNSF